MHTLEITVQRQIDGVYPIVVEETLSNGELPARAEGQFRLDQAELVALEGDIDAYGLALGHALFDDNVRDAFVQALGRDDERVRVLLSVEEQALRGLRWERLYAPLDEGWSPLLRNQRAPFSRYLPSLTDRRFPPIGRRDLKALIVSASPADLARYSLSAFDVEHAVAVARKALGEIPADILADLPGAIGRPTLDALCERLSATHYSILHVIAHGRVVQDGETVLYLAGNAGPSAVGTVTGTRLIERLKELQGARGLPHLFFLASCETASADAEKAMGGLGQRLVSDLGMPAVLAMTEKVPVDAAYELTTQFYGRLREHGEPDRALVEAVGGMTNREDLSVPALFSRLGGRPLFSDTVDRALTPSEVEFGLTRLASAVEERAPVLKAELAAASAMVRQTLGMDAARLSADARKNQGAALATLETICNEATELGFKALALNDPLGEYNANCPFPGLRAFTAEQRDFFCGREDCVKLLTSRLSAHPFLAILGPNGSGKSSLVFAGLIPALQAARPGLQMVSFRPGSQPSQALAEALKGLPAEAQAVVVVDQFDELLSLDVPAEQRNSFFDELLALPSRFPTVITMRADGLGELKQHPRLYELVLSNQEPVEPLSQEELRRAIEQQAARAGLRFEAGLSNKILDDVRDEPGAMPLLQHALQALWERRRGRWLRADEYNQKIGGVLQAIAFSANAIYDRALPTDQEYIRTIFLRLTRLDRGGGEQRRDSPQRVRFVDLIPAGADAAAIRAVVNRLAEARLLVTGRSPNGEETIEVAHEALIRNWPRLRNWLNEDRAALLLRERVAQAARDWATASEEQGYLLRGGALDEAVALAERPRFGLNALEQRFVEAGKALRQQELAEAEAARQRELEQARALAESERKRAETQRRWTIVASAIALVAVIAAVAAVVGFSIAEQNRRIADANAREAAQRALVADADAALARGETDQAQALALASLESSDPQPQAYYVLAEAADGGARRRFDFPATVNAAAFSPDGDLMIAGDAQGNLRGWDPQSGAELRNAKLAAAVRAILFLPNRSGILIASADGNLNILDAVGVKPLSGGNGRDIKALAISADGTRAFTGADDGSIRAWDLVAGEVSTTLLREADKSQITGLEVLERGSLLVALANGTLLEIDADSGTQLGGASLRYNDNNGDRFCNPSMLTLYPDLSENLAYIGCETGEIIIWNVSDGVSEDMLYYSYAGHDARVLDISFSADANSFVSSSFDQSVRLWDDITGKVLAEFKGHAGEVYQVAIDPQGRWLITAGFDKTLREWDMRGGQLLRDYQPDGRRSNFNTARLNSDGSQLTMLTNRMFMQFDAASGNKLNEQTSSLTWFNALSPDGSLGLVNDSEGDGLAVWDIQQNQIAARLQDSSGAENAFAAFSYDNGLLFLAINQDAPRLYNVADGSLVRTMEPIGNANISWAVTFSRDGSKVISGTDASDGVNEGIIWDVASGTINVRLAGHSDVVTAANFSADGTKAITGSFDRTILIWDLTTSPPVVSQSFVGHTRTVRSVALSADGTLLLSGGEDRNAILWDAASGIELARYAENDGAVTDVFFDPTGAIAYTSTLTGDLRSWRVVGRDALVDWVQTNRQPNALSCELRTLYLLPCPAAP